MWPFGRKDVATRLSEIEERTEVEVVAKVVSPNAVASPISGARAAMLHIEVLELRGALSRRPKTESLGAVVLGDFVTLRDAEGIALSIIARRARFRFAGPDAALVPLDEVPEE